MKEACKTRYIINTPIQMVATWGTFNVYICRFSKNPSLALANFTGSSVSSIVINSVQYDLDGVSIDTPRTEPC